MKRKTRTSFNHKLTFATTKPKKRGWLISALGLPVIAVAVAYGPWKEAHVVAPPTAMPSAMATPAEKVAAPAPPPVKKVDIDYVVRPNDTLGQIFRQLNLDATQLPSILGLPLVRDRFKALKPGDRLMLSLENGALHGIDRRISDTERLSIVRSDGRFTAKVISTPIEIKTAHVRGTINLSLLAAGRTLGLTPEMIQQLANDIFGWDIDFALDLHAGDRFNVIYEQKYRDNEYIGDGRIVAAEFINDGETYRAIRYTSPDGKIDGYFTPEGKNVRREFLRIPLEVTRAANDINASRRQPLLNVMHDHQGIDYAAAAGTAIKATSDGRIKFVGVNGEYGNTVIVEHGDSISTLYAHLSGFARGLQNHQRVKQGEVIGYVGATGAATAPHLHYEYRVNGVATDFPTTERAEGKSLPEEYLEDFRSKSANLIAALEQSGDAVVTALLGN